MIGYLFIIVAVIFIGYKGYSMIKEDRSKVDRQIKPSGRGGGSSVPFETDDLVEGEPEVLKQEK